MSQERSLAGRLFTLAFFGALAYFAWTWGWPRLQDRFEGATGPGGECVRAATRTYRDFATEKHPFAERRQDTGAWVELRSATTTAIRDGKSLCACGLASCAKSRKALYELEQLVMTFDVAVDARNPVGDTSVREATIERLLGEAKALARDGG